MDPSIESSAETSMESSAEFSAESSTKLSSKLSSKSPLGNNDSIFKYDSRSTYFYEALLNSPMTSSGFTIKWVEEGNLFSLTQGNIHSSFRKNVPYYEAENKKCLWKSESDGKYFTSGKLKYKQCMRNWRFYLWGVLFSP
ncbi:MAG: hypothetical protein SNI49_09665 [Rikenellaceae bacterium]